MSSSVMTSPRRSAASSQSARDVRKRQIDELHPSTTRCWVFVGAQGRHGSAFAEATNGKGLETVSKNVRQKGGGERLAPTALHREGGIREESQHLKRRKHKRGLEGRQRVQNLAGDPITSHRGKHQV